MIRFTVGTLIAVVAAEPLLAQQFGEVNGQRTAVFAQVGRPPREALGYGDAVFVTPATLEAFGVEPNSVVRLRYPGAEIEARIFSLVDEGRRDGSIYMAKQMRDALGLTDGLARVEVVSLGESSETLGPPETDLPPCGDPNALAFKRVSRPPQEALALGDAALIRLDYFEALELIPGTPATVTVGNASIDVTLHPIPQEGRATTTLYMRGSMREALGIEDGDHQVRVDIHRASMEDGT